MTYLLAWIPHTIDVWDIHLYMFYTHTMVIQLLTQFIWLLRVASMPAVRSDLNGGLLTCLCFIMYQEYTVICIFDQMHVNLIWYLYPFMLNKICLSLSLSLNSNSIMSAKMYLKLNIEKLWEYHICSLEIYEGQTTFSSIFPCLTTPWNFYCH